MYQYDMMIKNISTLLFLSFLMICATYIPTFSLFNNPIFYSDETDVFRLNQTNSFLFRSKGFILSNTAQRSIIISQRDSSSSSLYDLYLGFDGKDVTNNYTTIKRKYTTNTFQKVKGNTSAKFTSGNDAIILFPNSNSIFNSSDTSLQDFTITFSLHPYRSGEGTQDIVSYEAFFDHPLLGTQPTGFSITIEKGIVNYHFKNFFVDENGNYYSFILKEQKPLIDTKWEQHTLVVNFSKNVIKIYRNQTEEDVAFIKQDQTYLGKVLYLSPYFAKAEEIPLIIGENGVFSLDEFIIYRNVVTSFLEYIPNQKNFFETDVFRLSQNVSTLHEMNIDVSDTNFNYRLAYRFSNDYFFPDTSINQLPWIYVDPAKKIFPPSQSMGKFLQWRVEYYSPPVQTEEVFFVRDISTIYKETFNPGTISVTSVIAKDGAIEISWQTLPSSLVTSYEIYYGDEPNNYFGTARISPSSPVFIEASLSTVSQHINYILEGLTNEKPYYISIRAKDIFGQYGPFSPEIVSKPSSINTDFGYSIGR